VPVTRRFSTQEPGHPRSGERPRAFVLVFRTVPGLRHIRDSASNKYRFVSAVEEHPLPAGPSGAGDRGVLPAASGHREPPSSVKERPDWPARVWFTIKPTNRYRVGPRAIAAAARSLGPPFLLVEISRASSDPSDAARSGRPCFCFNRDSIASYRIKIRELEQVLQASRSPSHCGGSTLPHRLVPPCFPYQGRPQLSGSVGDRPFHWRGDCSRLRR